MSLSCLLIHAPGSLAFPGAKPLSSPLRHVSGATSPLIATRYGTVFEAPVITGNQNYMLLVIPTSCRSALPA